MDNGPYAKTSKPPTSQTFQRLNRTERREFLLNFIEDTKEHLNEGGVLLLNALTSDVDFIGKNTPNCTIERKKDAGINTVLAIRFSS